MAKEVASLEEFFFRAYRLNYPLYYVRMPQKHVIVLVAKACKNAITKDHEYTTYATLNLILCNKLYPPLKVAQLGKGRHQSRSCVRIKRKGSITLYASLWVFVSIVRHTIAATTLYGQHGERIMRASDSQQWSGLDAGGCYDCYVLAENRSDTYSVITQQAQTLLLCVISLVGESTALPVRVYFREMRQLHRLGYLFYQLHHVALTMVLIQCIYECVQLAKRSKSCILQ
jgi:hypothetical protein